MNQKLKKILTASRTVKNRKIKIAPLILGMLCVSLVGASLTGMFNLDVTQTGNVVVDPYWIKLTTMADEPITNVVLGDITQGESLDTEPMKLVLVNPTIPTKISYSMIGTPNTGVTVDLFDNSTGTPQIWETNLIDMGNTYPDTLEIFFRTTVDYSAIAGPLGSFSFQWVANEYIDDDFDLSFDPVTTDTDCVSSESDFTMTGIIPGGSTMYYTELSVGAFDVDDVLMTYDIIGSDPDITVSVEYMDGTWQPWDEGVQTTYEFSSVLTQLRIGVTASEEKFAETGLDILDVTFGLDFVSEIAFNGPYYATGSYVESLANMALSLTSDIWTVIASSGPTVGSDVVMSGGGEYYSVKWNVAGLPTGVSMTAQYSLDGTTYNSWPVNTGSFTKTSSVNCYARFYLTFSAEVNMADFGFTITISGTV